MSDTFATGKTFQTGEQVTANDLNNAVNQATPKVALTDDLSITVNASNKLTVKDGDSTNGVPLTKLKHIIGHSVIGNTGSATAAPTNIEVAANEAVLGNSAGNGLITDKIDTDNIKDDAITQGKTDFINATTGSQTLTGTSPNLTFDDTNNVVTNKPFLNGNTTDGGLHVRAQEANSTIQNLGTGKVLLATSDTPGSDVTDVSEYVTRLEVSSTSGKDASGNASAGAKVDGDLQVTGDLNVGNGFSDIKLKSASPKIEFEDTDASVSNSYIQSFNSGNLEIKTEEANSLVRLDGKKGLLVEYDGSNTLMEANATAATDAQGNANQSGVKIHGDLEVTGGINIGDTINEGISIDADSGTTHEILLGETLTVTGGEGVDTTISNNTLTVSGENASTSNKGVAKFNSDDFSTSSGTVSIKTGGVSNSQLDNSSVTVSAGTGLSGGGSVALGGSTTINLNSAIPDNSTTNTQASTDNSTKLATTAFVQNQLNVGGLGYATLTRSSQSFSATGGTVDHTLSGFTISNNGITVSEGSNGAISVPSGIYMVIYNVKDITYSNPSGSSALTGRMSIERNGLPEVTSEFEGAEGQTRLANSLSGLYTGGTNFTFRLGRRRTSNTHLTQTVTPNGMDISIIRIA